MRYHFDTTSIHDLSTFLLAKRIAAAAGLLLGLAVIALYTDIPGGTVSGGTVVLGFLAILGVAASFIYSAGHIENGHFNSAGVTDLYIGPLMVVLTGLFFLGSVFMYFTVGEGGTLLIVPIAGGLAATIYLCATFVSKYGSISSSIDWEDANRDVRNDRK